MSEETTINGMPKGHMERYHPHGIREGDICKYLQGIGKTTVQPKGANAKNRYATLAEEITADNASLWLWDNLHCRCFHCKGEEDFKYLGIYDRFGKRNFLERGFPVSKEVFEKDVKAFYAVCRDLIENFQNIGLDIQWFLPWNFNKRVGGKSPLDLREGVSYIAIGDTDIIPFEEGHYAHDDSRYIYDIIRHEIGHSLSTIEKRIMADVVFDRTFKSGVCDKQYVLDIRREISEWACYAWDAKIMPWVLRYEGELDDIKEESYAELFSAYTDPNFNGKFPKYIIDIPKLYCGEIPLEKIMKEATGMDAGEKKIKDMSCFAPRPFWLSWADAYYNPRYGEWVPGAEGYVKDKATKEGSIIVMPNGEPDSPYATWDYLNGKWIEFKNRQEKCRYLEKLYGRTDKEIEELINNKELFDGYYPELKKGKKK